MCSIHKANASCLQAKTMLYREAWRQFRDIKKSNLTVGPQPGDLRAAMAPFIAAKAAGPENFKWMMFGDDDTVFFVDNVLQVCAQELAGKAAVVICAPTWKSVCNTRFPTAASQTCKHQPERTSCCCSWWRT